MPIYLFQPDRAGDPPQTIEAESLKAAISIAESRLVDDDQSLFPLPEGEDDVPGMIIVVSMSGSPKGQKQMVTFEGRLVIAKKQ